MGKPTFISLPDSKEKTPVIFLSRGAFTKAYRSNDKVYAYTIIGKHTDYSKEAIATFCEGKHIPAIEVLGESNEYRVYQMPFYQKLEKKHAQAWSDFRKLLKIWEKLVYGATRYLHGYELCEAFEKAVRDSDLSDDLKGAVTDIMYAVSNYGDSYRVEICQRNLKVDKDGNLILLDIVFNPIAKRIGW